VTLEAQIKARALGLGFDLVGVTRLGEAESSPRFDDWIARGFAGEMEYLERGAEKRKDTRRPFAPASTAIVVGLDYGGRAAPGPVARYARGDDYHDVMVQRLDELHRAIEVDLARPISGKSYVDTGPILERDLARKAGLGWFGKNTNLINPGIGSFFFIGSLVLDLELEPDAPFEFDRCGTCRKCIDACPTDAIVDDRVIDATKCIAYLTIELKSAIPTELRAPIGDKIYGCDICQEVCPWNISFASELRDSALAPRPVAANTSARELALEILAMDETTFREKLRGSPMKRAKLRGLKRNASVVLGNIGNRDDLEPLATAARDADPLVREHAEWALARLRAATPTE
jgi:epoxyqueuosine reductase